MPILPLPQFEADLEEDRKIYENLKPPTSIVVRFGIMKLVGEFPYSGDAKPGCGSKLVVRTHRGTELGEMLTSTCPNSGCSKSVSRKEMLEYIDNSGGRDYPFFNQGKVLRIATPEDLNEQARLDATRAGWVRRAREIAERYMFPGKFVDVEPILGGERMTFYFSSEDRLDFREVVNDLAAECHTRIEMRQVGARDEARLVADYEKCGQHCCCKQFLKVLKPVSMKSAKIQKATLDPLKISGRCGRLMCCLRYEDSTYDDLRARLPKKKTRVTTPDGPGTVLDTQILTQLVLVIVDGRDETAAYPLEELTLGGPPAPPMQQGPPAPSPARPPQRSGGDSRPDAQRPAPGDRRGPGAGGAGGGGGGNESGRGQRSGPGGPPPRSGPPGPRPPQPPRDAGPSSEPRPAPDRDDVIDLDDIETDFGHDHRRPPQQNGPRSDGGQGAGPGGPNMQRPEGEGGRRRRRRRRGRNGPGGAPGGGGGGAGGGDGSGGGGDSPGAG